MPTTYRSFDPTIAPFCDLVMARMERISSQCEFWGRRRIELVARDPSTPHLALTVESVPHYLVDVFIGAPRSLILHAALLKPDCTKHSEYNGQDLDTVRMGDRVFCRYRVARRSEAYDMMGAVHTGAAEGFYMLQVYFAEPPGRVPFFLDFV